MKFIDVKSKEIKKGDYICYQPSRSITTKVYGKVRVGNNKLFVQGNNAIQILSDKTIVRIRATHDKYFRTIIGIGKFQKLVD